MSPRSVPLEELCLPAVALSVETQFAISACCRTHARTRKVVRPASASGAAGGRFGLYQSSSAMPVILPPAVTGWVRLLETRTHAPVGVDKFHSFERSPRIFLVAVGIVLPADQWVTPSAWRTNHCGWITMHTTGVFLGFKRQ